MVRYALVGLFAIGVAAAADQQEAPVSQKTDALRAENEQTRQDIDGQEPAALHPDNEQLRRKVVQSNQTPAALRAENERLRREIAALKEIPAALLAENEQLRQENAGLKQAPVALRTENEQLREEIVRLKEAPPALRAENERLRQEIAGMKEAHAIPAVAQAPTAPRAATAPAKAAASSSHFRNARWGMTKTEVMQSEAKAPRSDSGSILTYDDKVAGLDVVAGYIFESDVLTRATYLVTDGPANKNEYIDDYRHVVEALRKKYGKETDDRTIWSDRMFADQPDNYGLAISMAHLAMVTEWNTPDTKVLAVLRGDNYEVKLKVEYASKEHMGIEKPTKDPADKDKL